MPLEGIVRTGIRTKELVKQLCKNEIAVINHNDIDVLSAVSLINAGVTAIINTGSSMTGRTETKGAKVLINNRVLLYDVSLPFEAFNDRDIVSIGGCNVCINGVFYKKCCKKVNNSYISINTRMSRLSRYEELHSFIGNSLEHAQKDMNAILSYDSYPELETILRKKQVIIVVRNTHSMEELAALREYIKLRRPVLIGVDGGADLLLNAGYTPDILIGDMDSVTAHGIRKSKEIILHVYPDGYCPFINRIEDLGKVFKTISMPGTSEDMALLLSYRKGAEVILLIGGHSSMEDFLSKGRKGMGSTVITRLMVSDRLIDMKNMTSLKLKEIPFIGV